MAFLKRASGVVVHRGWSPENWGNFVGENKARLANGPYRTASGAPNLVAQASEILGEEFDPKSYLLTHATIVASVDTEEVPNVKLGSVVEDGRRVVRKWSDYRITPETQRWTNNNGDSWSRGVLLKSYRTFVGAHNFCFVPGTLVLMADGSYRSIESVEVGDEVITHEGRARRVTHRFEREFEGDIKEVYVDRFKRPLLVTGNHPFRTIDVSVPHLGSRRGSDPYNRARYERDQIVRTLRGDPSAFDTDRRIARRVAEMLRRRGPSTEVEIVAESGASLSGLRRMLRRELDLFARRPMRQEERKARSPRVRNAHVWELRDDVLPKRLAAFHASKGWTPARALEPHRFVLGPERVNGSLRRVEEATLLGYYLAEGCLYGVPGAPTGFVLSFGPHERHLAEHAQGIVRRLFPGLAANINPTQTTLRVDVYSREAGEWAVRMGGHLAHEKRLSRSVYDWDQESLLHLLGAWMAGDGNVHQNTFRLRGTSTSEVLAQQMLRVSEIAGIKASVVFERRAIGEIQSHVTLVVGGAPKVYEVINRHHAWTVLVSKDSVHEITTRSPRWGATLHRVRAVRRERDDMSWWENCRVHKVAKVLTSRYEGKVYNLEVEEDHSYVVDHGVAVHNCEHVQLESQSRGRIVDAVARDIGPSVYVDILVATNRKHASLIQDIENGRMGTLSMGCFLPDAQVSLADGRRVSIRDVQPGDLVLSHRGRTCEVTNRQEYTSRWRMRRIHAAGTGSPVVCTVTHPVFVLRPRKVCACGCGEPLALDHQATDRRLHARFKNGHRLRILNPNGSYSLDEMRRRKALLDDIYTMKVEEVAAGDLRPGDFMCFPRTFVPDTEEGPSVARARLLGYFLAEGSFIKYKGEPVETQFNFSMAEKDSYVAEVCRLLREEFSDCKPWVQDRVERNTCVVHVSGRSIAEWFRAHGGEYSHGKRISAEAMGWPTSRLLHVVGAWMNGDGSTADYGTEIPDEKRSGGTTVSYDLACQVHSILMRAGVFCRFSAKVYSRSVTVAEVVNGMGIGGVDADSGRRPSYTIDLGMTMGQELRGYTDRIAREPKNVQGLRLIEDYVIFPITEIEDEVYEGTVYDLEVEEDHSYVVEGCAVHNCTCVHTTCTKCGNVGHDETELCPCVRYEKGNAFYDQNGIQHKVAELCGHASEDPTGGVNFIEASWVAVPAFAGAVMRNILHPEAIDVSTNEQVRRVLASPPPEWTDADAALQKAASQDVASSLETPARWPRAVVARKDARVAQFGPPADEPGGDKPEKKDPIEALEDEIESYVLDKVKKRIKEKLKAEVHEEAASDGELDTSTGDSVIKQAANQMAHGTAVLLGVARSDVELVDGIARLASSLGIKVSRDLYRTALRVGPARSQESLDGYLSRCGEALGRQPTTGEAKTLVRLGRILSMWARRASTTCGD